jgi:intracellular multiplication protein IcmP
LTVARDDKKEGSESAYIVGALIFAGGAWLLWAKARPVIVEPLFALDWLEYHLLLWLNLLNPVGKGWLEYITKCLKHPAYCFGVQLVDIRDIQMDIGNRMKWPIILCVLGFTVLTAFTMKGQGFKKTFTLTGSSLETVVRLMGIEIKQKWLKKFLTNKYDSPIIKFFMKYLLLLSCLKMITKSKDEWVKSGTSFMHYQAEHWKVVLAGAHFDPDKLNPAELPQLSPMEWLRNNKVTLEKGKLDTDAAERVFTEQLGPTWSGLESSPYHVQAICILAALNATLDKGVGKFRERLTEIHVLQPGSAEAETRKLMAPYLANKSLVERPTSALPSTPIETRLSWPSTAPVVP